MKPSISKRLEALEASVPKVDRAEDDKQIHLACDALQAAYDWKRPWAKDTVAPFYWKEQPSELELLWQRLKAGTATEADRAVLASLPRCNFTPEELVETLARLNDSF